MSDPLQVQTNQHWKQLLDTLVEIYRSARITARAMFREHPYALLFLLTFGVFLFPLSSTAIAGTLTIIAISTATILICTIVFAPSLFILAVLAFLTWCAGVLALCLYRYKWAATEHEMTMSRQRSARWSAFKSTLSADECPVLVQHVRSSTPDAASICSLQKAEFSVHQSVPSPIMIQPDPIELECEFTPRIQLPLRAAEDMPRWDDEPQGGLHPES